MSLEFTFDVSPDAHGVFDGRELARRFIGTAFQLIVPYVPGCADALFSRIANDVMEELHRHGRDEGRLPSAIYAIGPAGSGGERERDHLDAASTGTAALRRAQLHHDNHDDEDGNAAPSWDRLDHVNDLEDEIPFWDSAGRAAAFHAPEIGSRPPPAAARAAPPEAGYSHLSIREPIL